MEKSFVHSEDGQEVESDDVNLMSDNGGLADDRILWELLRLNGKSSGQDPRRGILTYGVADEDIIPAQPLRGLVVSSGGADASVDIYPFRAVIGPTAIYTSSESTHSEAHRGVRSGYFIGNPATSGRFYRLQLEASTQKRFDLIYARVTIDAAGPSVARFVKQSNDSPSEQLIATTKLVTVEIDVVNGTETAGTPTRPTAPADASGVYCIPLAYVRIPAAFSATNTITDKGMIQIVANELILSTAIGAAAMKVASIARTLPVTGGTVDLTGTATPAMYLPIEPGLECRVFAIDPAEVPAATRLVIDDSRDWRNRFFKIYWAGLPAATKFAHQNEESLSNQNLPAQGFQYWTMANSFVHPASDASQLAWIFTNSNSPDIFDSGTTATFYVDAATGYLTMQLSAAFPTDQRFFVWFEATGQAGLYRRAI